MSIGDLVTPMEAGARRVLTTEAVSERLDYCLNTGSGWRPRIWGRVAMDLLGPLESFRGKRLLELGTGAGWMSCLFAAFGALVTGIDVQHVDQAQEEAMRWGVESRVRFISYDGDYRNLPAEKFDVVFTKSMMGFRDKRRLPELLIQIREQLAPGGVVLFLENANNWLLDKIRRNITYRTSRWDKILFGLYPTHITIIREVFDSAQVRRYYGIVWAIRVGGN